MNVYFDTSALVKLWIEEEGATRIRLLTEEATNAATSLLTHAELRSTFARLRRERRLDEATHGRLRVQAGEQLARMIVIGLSFDLVADAGELAEVHGLKTLDALHLTAALGLRQNAGLGDWVFATFDLKLARAAAAEGFAVTAIGP